MELERKRPGKQELEEGTEDTNEEEERKMEESLQDMLRWDASLGISDSSSAPVAISTEKSCIISILAALFLRLTFLKQAGGYYH